MTRSRLLMVTFHFPPVAACGSFRMLGFARHLPEEGWDPIVVAPARVPWEPYDPDLAAGLPREVALRPIPWPSGLAWRPLIAVEPYAPWLLSGLKACERIMASRRPDAVLTTGPPHLTHWIGLQLKRRYGIPWTVDFRDPWMTRDGSTPICDAARGRLRPAYLRRLERLVIRHSDTVLCTAPTATERLRSAFPADASRIVTLTNGFDPDRFEARPAPRPAGRLKLTHAGEIYAGRDPLPLLDAIAGLEGDDRPTSLRFLGQMAHEPRSFDDEVRRLGLGPMVEVAGQVPYEQALREMIDSEILILLDTPGRRVGIPAKLFEYLGAGRPVLALGEGDGDLAWALRESRIVHRIAPPRDVPAIRQAIAELAAICRGGPPADDRLADDSPFTRQRLAGQLARILDAQVERAADRPQGRRASSVAARLAGG